MSTAVFSTCDVKFWRFAVSTFLTLPKQLILVYLGVLLVQEQDGSTVKDALFAVAGLVTIAAGVWIWFKMGTYKKQLLEEQAQRQNRKEAERLALSRSDSGYAASGNAPAYTLAGPGGESMPSAATTIPSPTLHYDAWGQETGPGGLAAQQTESPRYEPYRPQYTAAATSQGQYGPYEQDNSYHTTDNSGDVGTASTHTTPYGSSEATRRQYGIRQVDNISIENGRPAQGHDFV